MSFLGAMFWISGDISSGFQSQSGSALFAFLWRWMLCTFPEIHLRCYTCQPLSSQHRCQSCPLILFPAEVMLLGFELALSEYL